MEAQGDVEAFELSIDNFLGQICARIEAIRAFDTVDREQRQRLKNKIDAQLFALSKHYARLVSHRREVKEKLI